MKKLFLLIFTLLPLLLVAKEEQIVLHTPTGDIYGTLLLPDSPLPVPVTLIIAGSGPTDRNGNSPLLQSPNNSLKYLAEELEQNGIASLRFDKRGIGESKVAMVKEDDLRFDTYIDDVKLWIQLLSKDKRLSSITIAGHSEGSLIGIIASAASKKVKSFVSIAGTALPADEIIKEQISAQPKPVQDMVFPALDTLKQGKLVRNVSPALYSLLRPSVQPYMISWMQYDPCKELSKLTIPILIVQGTTDIQIPVYHAEMLVAANKGAEKQIIESMNHVLKPCTSTDKMEQMTTYTAPDLPLAEKLIPAIVEFIVKHK
ncbi:MAG: lysophospholipase [Prevotellaceae bacterium]|jgi:pimeloyl-ACP methyl ester carboxylesterase|nr:lysophospholipase [Prevotellaceae bacterium]